MNLGNLGLACLLRGSQSTGFLGLHFRRLRREHNNFLTWHSQQGYDGDSVGTDTRAAPAIPGTGRTKATSSSSAVGAADSTDTGEQTGGEAVNPRVMVQRDASDSNEGSRIHVQSVAPETDNAADEVWETCADESGFCSCLGKVRFGPKAGHRGAVVMKDSPFGKVECGTMYVTAARFSWSSLAEGHLAQG